MASSADHQIDTCGDMVGDKFELHDTLAFVCKSSGRYCIEFGRTHQSLVGRQKEITYAVSHDKLPDDLRFVAELYSPVPATDRRYTFNECDGTLHEYSVEDVLGHANFRFD